MNTSQQVARCSWVTRDEQYELYHDSEWGHPVTDQNGLFERISLEGFQAGLSWITVLRKRAAFRRAFLDFDVMAVAQMTSNQLDRLAENSELIRNRSKIQAVYWNANVIVDQDIDLNFLVWHSTSVIAEAEPNDTESKYATELSKNMRAAGLKYVGPVSMHALAQAIGILPGHQQQCFLAK